MAQTPYNLVCVAHPDDETIFFGGLLQTHRDRPWRVICCTSDGDPERHDQFLHACQELGVTMTEWWGFLDRYDTRLPIDQLVSRLKSLPMPSEIFTHGIVGEYGHPHHQDVSFAVHRAFPEHRQLFSTAYNTFPELTVALTPETFQKKTQVLTRIYGSETNRFLNVLPATFAEGFCRLEFSEVEAIYTYLTSDSEVPMARLKAYLWLDRYLPILKALKRPF